MKPVLLSGATAIAEHLGMTTVNVARQHRQGTLPTFRIGGTPTPYATAGALDEWVALQRAGKLPKG